MQTLYLHSWWLPSAPWAGGLFPGSTGAYIACAYCNLHCMLHSPSSGMQLQQQLAPLWLHPASTCADQYWCLVPLTFSNLHWWCFLFHQLAQTLYLHLWWLPSATCIVWRSWSSPPGEGWLCLTIVIFHDLPKKTEICKPCDSHVDQSLSVVWQLAIGPHDYHTGCGYQISFATSWKIAVPLALVVFPILLCIIILYMCSLVPSLLLAAIFK